MTRPYTLRRRAEKQADTTRRIVRAAVDLHSTIGPSGTTISAIAERAGVQRHTVYAHFPDGETLFRACSQHWRDEHPIPEVSSLDLRGALAAMYEWYEETEQAVALLARDAHLYPEIWAAREQRLVRVADEVARPLGRRHLVRAAVGHALAFETWRSLVRREGLTNRGAADAMVAFVSSV
jgi:AcrR family transcriptional regulator